MAKYTDRNFSGGGGVAVLFFALAWTCFVCSATGQETGGDAANGGNLRVATFNVYNIGLSAKEICDNGQVRFEVSERGKLLQRWILRQKLDVVCLQETGALPMARYLAASTPLRYYHFDVSRRHYVQPYKNAKGVLVHGYPVTILSRFPILERGIVKGGDGREMLTAKIQISPKQTVWICSFHATPSRTLKAAASYAPTWVKLKDEMTIVCGDFNTFPRTFRDGDLAKLPGSGYVDVWAARHPAGDAGGTFRDDATATAPPNARIDFIWASQSLAKHPKIAIRIWPTKIGGKRAWIGDHCPVLAEFSIAVTRGPLPKGPKGPVAVAVAKVVSDVAPPVVGPLSLPIDFEKGQLPSDITCVGGTIGLENEAGNVPQGSRSLAWMPNAGGGSTLRIPLKSGELKAAHWLTFQIISRRPLPLAATLTVSAPTADGQNGTWSGQFAVRPGSQKIRLPLSILADRRSGQLKTDGAVKLAIWLPAMSVATPFYLDNVQAVADPVPGSKGRPGLFLDFGSDRAVWPGARGVTCAVRPPPGSPVRWQSKARLANFNLRTPDVLTADFAGTYSNDRVAAKISLPTGRYTAVLWLTPVSRYNTIGTKMGCRIDGRRVLRRTLTSRQFLSEQGAWRGVKALQAGKVASWADLYEQTFKRYESFVSSNGSVTVEFVGCGLAAAAFVPHDQRREVSAWLDRLEKARKAYFNQWVFCPRSWINGPVPAQIEGPLAEAGLNAWQVSIKEGLFGKLDPSRPRIRDGLALTAAAGQRVTVLLALNGESCEHALSVRSGTWRTPAGSRGQPNTAVTRLLCFPIRKRGPIYVLRPWIPGPDGRPSGFDPKWRFYLVKILVPENASPGQYESSLRVLASHAGKTLNLPLRLTVRPFQLASTGDVDLGVSFNADAISAYASTVVNAKLPKSMVKDSYQHMANLGFNTTVGWARLTADKGKVRFDASNDYEKIFRDGIRQAGLVRKHHVWINASRLPSWLKRNGFKPGTATYRGASRRMFDAIGKFWSKLDATPVYMNHRYAHNRDPERAGRLIGELRAVNALPRGNAQLAMFLLHAPREERILKELLQPAAIACLYNYSENEEVMRKARSAGKKIWLYDNSLSRYSFGFQLHRIGATGRWGLATGRWLRPFDPAWPRQGGILLYGPNGVVPLLKAEQAAEGIVDLRHALTLTRMIAAAKAKGVATAEAEAALDAMNAAMRQRVKDDLIGSPLENVDGWSRMNQWQTQLAEAAAALARRMER